MDRLRETLSYKATLARGYAVVRGGGEIVTTKASAENAAALEIEFSDGRLKLGGGGAAPRKSKAISKLSHILLDKYDGEVPVDLEALEELPGVGHKTASVVISQAFGIPAFPVDTHIHRLAHRWTLSTGKNVVKTETDLKKVFPREKWNKLHLQIIFFGREYCPARGHDPRTCPICSRYGRKSLFKN